MSVFRRTTPRTDLRQGMPPRPSVLNHQAPDPAPRGAWITQAPLNPDEDPCGRGPVASASSKSGAAS